MLQQLSSRLSRPTVRRPPPVDVLVAAGFVAMVLAEAVFSDTVLPRSVHALVTVPAMASLAWRRTFPVAVATLVVLSDLIINPNGQYSTLLSLVLVAYTVGSEARPPRHWIGLGVVVVPFLGGIYVMQGELVPSDVAAAIVFLVGPWTVGMAMRQRSERTEEAVERAATLEREREQHTAAAAAEERARIARELHDIVSHSISVVAIQTQAVRRRLGPDHAREADDLAAVETTARQALAEMRRLFGVLRNEGESLPLAPQPGLAELGRLTQHVRAAGLSVELRTEGESTPLTPGVDLAAYRIVQEGLTNALRHAQARHATVTIRYGDDTIDVVVEDDGVGVNGQASRDGTGHGLVGVRERVTMYGGSVEAGPRPAGGFRLAARLPFREQR